MVKYKAYLLFISIQIEPCLFFYKIFLYFYSLNYQKVRFLVLKPCNFQAYKNMKPRPIAYYQKNSSTPLIELLISKVNKLKVLADNIDWEFLRKELSKFYKEGVGKPPKPIRLMVTFLILQYMHNLSNRKVVEHWVTDYSWQYFSGYKNLQKKAPIHHTSIVHFRKRIGQEGIKKIFQLTIEMAISQGLIKKKN